MHSQAKLKHKYRCNPELWVFYLITEFAKTLYRKRTCLCSLNNETITGHIEEL